MTEHAARCEEEAPYVVPERVRSAGLTLGQLIDAQPLRRVHWLVFVLCGAIVLLDGYDLQALGLAAPVIARRWAIPPPALGWPLSASLVGLGIASVLVAPLGDKWGRRPVLLGGLACIALSSGLTALAHDPATLALFRLFTGAGLGVCQANATALAAEWAPRDRRASVVTIISCQVALGALLAGLLSPKLLAEWDWPGIFLLGGLGPLVLSLLVACALPESPSFLQASERRLARFRRVLQTLAPGAEASDIRLEPHSRDAPGSFRAVLGARYRQRTFAFWAMFVVASFLVYLLISWLPVVLTQAGWSTAASARGISLYQAGGIVGALLLARCIDRELTFAALAVAYMLAGCAGAAFQYGADVPGVIPVLLFVLGMAVSGGLFGALAVGALLYPPQLRATGLGLGAAVARLGAALGPLVGGWVLTGKASAAEVLSWLALPAGLAAMAVLYLRWATHSAPRPLL
jgi:MFS transporter, AAHS family, 4-hydroxybenzoate transporter